VERRGGGGLFKKECEGADCIQLAQDRLALVNTAINLLVPYKAGIF
jgi:hypothetical protein